MIRLEELRELLSYDPDTGIFRWLKSINNRVKIGDIPKSTAGKGYYAVQIYGCRYYLHRLAMFYVSGEWPPNDVDHINGDIKDNRISNLRHATRAENLKNSKPHKDSQTGFKGVSFDRQRGDYMARVCINGKTKNLGRFKTANEAAVAYQSAAKERHGEFFRAA